MLSSDWKSFWKHPSHPLHFDIFHFSFIKKKGLEDSGMTGFRTKGKPWGTDDLSGCIPLNECCCLIISRNSLWLNMDVVKDYSNDPGCLKGRFWSPPLSWPRETPCWSGEKPDAVAVDLCHDTVIDWLMSGKQDHLTAIVFATAMMRMKHSKPKWCWIKWLLDSCLWNGYSGTWGRTSSSNWSQTWSHTCCCHF